jgi:hypothetical protein
VACKQQYEELRPETLDSVRHCIEVVGSLTALESLKFGLMFDPDESINHYAVHQIRDTTASVRKCFSQLVNLKSLEVRNCDLANLGTSVCSLEFSFYHFVQL